MAGNQQLSCLVIGAGIAGLTAARALQAAGHPVLVLDKGRGVGGRMATRRIGAGVFDHGAQFVTARSPRFQQAIERWQARGIAELWAYDFPDADGEPKVGGHPRYRGHPGMTAIPKALSQGLDIRLSNRLEAIGVQGGRWRASTVSGEVFSGDALVMTPPVPQSLQLLEKGAVHLPRQMDERLRGIVYDPCIALLVLLDRESEIPEPGAIRAPTRTIRWMADNRRKGLSPNATAVTIHAAPDFSRQYWESDDTEIADRLLSEVAAWIQGPVHTSQIQRWRYSQPVETDPEPGLFYAGPPSAVFAGDAFGGGRVEGAALSGWYAAERLMQGT